MVTDKEVIARASGGLALCGTYVGESEEQFGRVRARKQLLRSPKQCKLMNSDQTYTVRSHSCSNIEASERFREEVKNSGWTAAMKLHANVCGFDVEAFGEESRHDSKETNLSSTVMTKEACKMQVWYCPKASFAIPLHKMQLSDEAMNDARRVKNPSAADKFLSDYNSHVSTGKYHIGGVLMKGLVMKTRAATSLRKMLEKVSTNANLGAGVNFGLCEVGGKVEFSIEVGSSSTDLRGSHKATVKYVYAALGPRTHDERDFKARLNDKSTWDIIDIEDSPDLVPVWEIPSVRSAENLQNCCALLREAWQNSVKRIAAESQGRIYSLLQASYMENVKSLLDVSSTSMDLTMLKDILNTVWLEKTENLDPSRTKDLFQLEKFHDLLSRLAESTDPDSLHDGRELVRSLITDDIQVWLEKEGIHLRSSVQALFRNEVETVVPLPPLEDMSPGGLVDRLKILLERPSSSVFDSNAVAKAIRDFFRQNRNGGYQVEGVRKCIVVHGFDENGTIRDMTPMTREEVNVLVDQLERELESMSSGIRNPTPTLDLPEVEDVVAGPAAPGASRSRTSDNPTPNNEDFQDILGMNPHLLDLQRSSETLAAGSIAEGISRVYNRHMLVDRATDVSDDRCRLMMDRIRHRLEPFASTSSKAADVSQRKNFFSRHVNKGTSGDDIAKPHSTLTASPLEVLVQLLTSSDLLAQIALFQLLLDARIAIPLIVPLKTWTEESSFGHLAQALDFVRCKLAKQEILSIAEDTELPRVLFLSNRKSFSKRETSHMASKVMNFQLPSKFFKGDTGDRNTVIELGVGFLRTSEDESQDHKPCLVFCVWGDHKGLGKFLATVADFVIVEMDPSEDASSLSWMTGQSKDHIIYWKINPSDQGWESEPYFTFWGSFQQIADDIEGYLLQGIVEQKLFKGASKCGAATLKQCLMVSIPAFNKETLVSNLANLDGIDLEKAKGSLQLQKNFAKEAGVYFESLQRRSSKPKYDLERGNLQNDRKKLASKVQVLPLLQTFISILSLKNYAERNIGIVKLELNIEKKLHLILKRAYEKEAQAFEESQRNEDNLDSKKKYTLARREHVGKKLGLEHLWRELSHIFVANTRLKYLPQLAAEHLIDGFPLEILDGDAGMFNSVWVESVLSELNMVLSASLEHKPKVFVLSVIGLQSSGKSTLLNVMFGTKLKTSAGQCTRGVYLQLIKSERKEFDYVLILDTEGIRSPEFFGEKNADVHDNRLATFAVLPADACIVMVANEDDNGLKDVLPMVMLAFKQSAMTEQCAGRKQAKVFFAYRSVDTNDVSKLGRNERKLQEYLGNASRELGNVSIGARKGRKGPSPGSSTSKDGGMDTLLKDFRISTTEEQSDVKYFGNLKKGNVPPGDTPDWDYGTKVEHLREYIHKRVTDDGWKGYELKSWATHLKLVWDCIVEANFEISFRNQMEYLQFQVLQDKLVACRQQVGKKWMEESEKLAGDLQVKRGTVEGLDRSFQLLWNKLRLTVQQTVDEAATEVKRILDHPHTQKWKVDELLNWTNFCSDQEKDWQQRLGECIDAVFRFDNVVKDYNAKIQMEIDAKTGNFDMTSPNRMENMQREFDAIFRRILRQAEGEHPPMAEAVSSQVTRVYKEAKITGQRFDFPANEEPSDSNPQEMSSTRWFQKPLTKLLGYGDSTVRDGVREVIALLESKVRAYLQDQKQYADHLVEGIIRSTEKLTEVAKLSKREQYTVHLHVKKLLTEKLVAIQEKWDKNHNVSKRLEQEEQRLWLFFQNRVNQVDGTKLLFTEIDNLLRSKLMDSFRSNLSHHVSNKLMNDGWAGNWIVMRAHLDLHLIELIEASKTNELLACVRNGAMHYKTVADNLIETEIFRQVKDGHLWVSFLTRIKKAVTSAALRTSRSVSGASKSTVFAKSLVQSINDIGAGSLELTRNISNYVSEEVYSKYGNVLDFHKLARDVSRGLDTHIKPDLTSLSSQEVVKLVTERMILCATDNAGPRCAEMCPHCSLTCFRPENHPGHHDTLHQPAGLSGFYYEHSLELSSHSCSESVIAAELFKNEGLRIYEWTPFTDWNKHYTEWKVPTKGSRGTVHVREYIFARYQGDLAKFYSTKQNPRKICSEIPPHFLLHEIGSLRCQLESTIAST